MIYQTLLPDDLSLFGSIASLAKNLVQPGSAIDSLDCARIGHSRLEV